MNDTARRRYIRGIVQSLLILGGLILVTFMFQRVSVLKIVSMTAATALDDSFQPIDTTDTYAPDDTFYVAVEMQGYRPSMEVVARWRYEGQEITETPLETDGSGSGFAGFILRSNDPWPDGTYEVEILEDQQSLDEISFRVVED